ncbi:MAG: hypothetical protein ACI4T1_03715 [Christensenellales bacterium]
MIELNLQTSNKQEEIIKEYLENNVSEVLVDKINNGVKIIKDNKTLINKKTLSGFLKYAYEEARKLVEKGSNCACIEDKVVFGWAIHYFEEDAIEGNLYNEDGTEYKVEKHITKSATKVEVKSQQKKVESKQSTLFDLMNFEQPKEENLSYKAQLSTYSQPDILEDEEENDFDNDEEEIIKEKQEINNTKIDLETGEILYKEITVQNQTFDKFQLKTISMLLDGKVVLK